MPLAAATGRQGCRVELATSVAALCTATSVGDVCCAPGEEQKEREILKNIQAYYRDPGNCPSPLSTTKHFRAHATQITRFTYRAQTLITVSRRPPPVDPLNSFPKSAGKSMYVREGKQQAFTYTLRQS